MQVCVDCVIIPNNNFRWAVVFSHKRDTCCKCKKYTHYVTKILIKN